jgi:transposase
MYPDLSGFSALEFEYGTPITEAINGVIETTRRIARGFRNFTNYRLRCLLPAGGHRPYRNKQTNHA